MNQDIATGLLRRTPFASGIVRQVAVPPAARALSTLSHVEYEVTWTVPGDNRIAGTYRDREEVLDYFRRRRDLADHTFQMKRRDVLVGDGVRLAALTDGFARIADVDYRWSTVGLYDVIDRQIAACWLLPLDQRAFDAIWSA